MIGIAKQLDLDDEKELYWCSLEIRTINKKVRLELKGKSREKLRQKKIFRTTLVTLLLP